LIEFIAARRRFAFLCEAIARHEDPEYIDAVLRRQLFSYFAPEDFERKRLLDFGCGSGASTFALAAMLPNTEIVGVELDESNLEIARRIAEFKRIPNVRFLLSPSGDRLPAGMGTFDFVMLSAVYEHLLPPERTVVMPLIWSAMKTGSALFINQTPHRYIPRELAGGEVRRAVRNPALNKSGSWTDLLRGGIRGGTEREILRNLRGAGVPSILQPGRRWLPCSA